MTASAITSALSRALTRNLIAAQILWTASDRVLADRYGLGQTVRAGVTCFSARSFPDPDHDFGDLAIGFGILTPADDRTLDAVLAHYNELRLPARVAVLGRLSPQAVARRLRARGLREIDPVHHLFVRKGKRAPGRALPADVRIARVSIADVAPLAMLANVGFGGRGPVGEYFTRTRIAMLREHPRTAIALRATRGVDPAGSGILILTAGAGSLWSGNVLAAHRGRGIQRALIVERVRLGLARGARAFLSLAEPGSVSARNLARCGFEDQGALRVFTP